MDSGTYELAQAYEFLLKMIVIGDSNTGKTCLLHHFIHNSYKENSAHTIGIEFHSRVTKIGQKSVKLQIWDSAGQERFRSVTRSYYRGASACLLVYDISKRTTFENLGRWLADARALASPDLVVVVIGNKLDREDEREVGYVEASRWAGENDALFLECSSLTGENVETPFTLACKSILLAIDSGRINPEIPGSGISYGDRGLRRIGSSTGLGSRFSFSEMMPSSRSNGGVVDLKERLSGCC